ncbi:hypothetical protein EDB84DRAFT_1568351 [Lactarius hengduanensis]|nr:hypothetical protein EDB84DRAFT_1568351 [Lactarius hengduanensis]
MAQPPAPVSMSQALATAPSDFSSNIERIFGAALKSYKKKTKNDLKEDHDLFKQLETCDSPAAILAVFQASQFDPSRTVGDDSKGVALVLSPAKIFFAGVGVLLLVSCFVSSLVPRAGTSDVERSYEAIDVAASQDILVDIFGSIEGFFVWLEIYTEVPLTPAMTKQNGGNRG